MDGFGGAGSILECPVCKEIYEDPRILPCQHTICEKCLSSYIQETTQKGGKQQKEFPCPVCERNTKLKDGSSFPKSLTIVALLDSKNLKARIQKASSRRKSSAVTIETQTSEEELVADSTKLSEGLLQDGASQSSSGPVGTGNGSGYACKGLKSKNRRRELEKCKLTNRTNAAAKDNIITFEIDVPLAYVFFLEALNGNFADFLSLLYIVFVFDLVVLSALVYFQSVMGFLFIVFDLVFNYSDTSSFLNLPLNKHKRWWHGYFLINIDLMVKTTYLCICFLFWVLLYSFICTFYDAISDKQSMFTFEAYAENFMTRLYIIAHNVNDKDQKLYNIITSILLRLI